MKILVVGGSGAMAQVIVRDLLESPNVSKVGVADINLEKARLFVDSLNDDRAIAMKVDVRESEELTSLFKNWDVALNATWYEFNLSVMTAAIKAGVHHLDLGGLYHMTLKQLALDKDAKEAGVTCVLGMGSTPGTMNVMAAHAASLVDRIHSVKLRSGAVVVNRKEQSFQAPYSIRTVLDEFTLEAPILRNGKIEMAPPLSGKEQFELPEPVGSMEGYYTIHSELATLPTTLGKGVSSMDFIVAYPPEFTATLVLLVNLGLASRKTLRVRGQEVVPYDVLAAAIDTLPKPEEPELDVDIQRVELWGEKSGRRANVIMDTITGPHKRWNVGGGTVDTGVPPSIVAQWLASGKIKKHGVLPPESCVESLPFFKELNQRDRGIQVIETQEFSRQLS